MVVKLRLVVVDRNVQMALAPVQVLDLVVWPGKVDLRILVQEVDMSVILMVLEVADLVEVVYRRNRPSLHHSPQAVDLPA